MEETGATGMLSTRFSKPSRERNARLSMAERVGLPWGTPLYLRVRKSFSSQRPGRSLVTLQAHAEHFPCSSPFEPWGVWPWFSAVVPEPSPMTRPLVPPPHLPLHCGRCKSGCGRDQGWGGWSGGAPLSKDPGGHMKTWFCGPRGPGVLPNSTSPSPSIPHHPSLHRGFLQALLGTELTWLQTLSLLHELGGRGSRMWHKAHIQG